MKNADLAEIRALLRSTAKLEPPRPPGPLSALRLLLAPQAPSARRQRPALPPPRRVGLRPPEPIEADAEEDRRAAFGQRREIEAASPLLLGPPQLLQAPAPGPEPSPHAAETPYLPEDLQEAGEADRLLAERLLAKRLHIAREPEAPAVPPEPTAGLLLHLERVFLAEQAALQAKLAVG